VDECKPLGGGGGGGGGEGDSEVDGGGGEVVVGRAGSGAVVHGEGREVAGGGRWPLGSTVLRNQLLRSWGWTVVTVRPATTRPDPLYFKKLGVSVCESRNPGLAARADRPCSGPS